MPRPSGRKPLLLALLAAVAVLLLLPALWWRGMNVQPKVVFPSPARPQPNAFDDFQAAVDLFPPTESDRVGAALSTAPSGGPGETPAPRVSPAEQAALIRRNAEVLARVRQGLAHPYQEPNPSSANQIFPHYPGFRNLARLLRLEGEVRARRGDWAGALESQLDALQLGIEIPHGSPIIGLLVGSAVQAIGRRDAWETCARLPRGAARPAARRMERLCAGQGSYWETLETEKRFCQIGLLDTMRRPDWRRRMLADFTSMGGPVQPWPQTTDEWATFAQLHTLSKSGAYNRLADYMNAVIAVARQPNGLTAPLPPAPSDPVSQLILPAPIVEQARFRYITNRVLNELLLLGLALRAYRDDHGSYPVALTELSPAYLQALPTDPFAGTGGYRYRRARAGYALYSVGPDQKDDGGQALLSPTFRSSTNPIQRHKIEEGATGDIVAGINLQ